VEQRYKTGLITSHSGGLSYNVNQNKNIYNPNWIGSITWIGKIFGNLEVLDVLSYRYSSPITFSLSKQYATKYDYGYFFVSLKQGTYVCEYKYDRSNVVGVMATAGGFLSTSYLLMSSILKSYLSFTYDSSLMKRLYYEERDFSNSSAGQAPG